jgi:hypothetical protein
MVAMSRYRWPRVVVNRKRLAADRLNLGLTGPERRAGKANSRPRDSGHPKQQQDIVRGFRHPFTSLHRIPDLRFARPKLGGTVKCGSKPLAGFHG